MALWQRRRTSTSETDDADPATTAGTSASSSAGSSAGSDEQPGRPEEPPVGNTVTTVAQATSTPTTSTPTTSTPTTSTSAASRSSRLVSRRRPQAATGDVETTSAATATVTSAATSPDTTTSTPASATTPATGATPATSSVATLDGPGSSPAAPGAADATESTDTPESDVDYTVGLRRRARLRRSIATATPVTLAQAAHPRQGLITALAMAVAASLSGRAGREVLVVFVTVLVGQTILGWHNDIEDRERDARHHTQRKPIADGRLEAGTAWYAFVVAFLLLIPLSFSTGVTAGAYYLVSVVLGILANVVLRRARFSWVPWAAAFALLPFYLSYGGWGGGAEDAAPQVAMVVLAALLGVGVHLVRAIWGLPADDADGWTYYPLSIGRRIGTTRLLLVGAGWCIVVVAAIAVVGATVGLRQ